MARPTGSWAFLSIFGSGIYGSRWESGVWLKPDTALPGAFDVQAAATTLYNTFATAFASIMNEQNQYLGGTLLVNNGVYTASASVNSQKPGVLDTAAIPPDDFIVVRSQSDVAGPKGKGRILLGGLDVSIQAEGRVNSAGNTAMLAIISVLTAAVSAGGASFTAQQYNHKDNVLSTPDFWSYNPVLGNRKKRSPIF